MQQREWLAPVVLWVVWIAFLAAWTVALLIPIPAEASAMVGGDDAKFLVAKSIHVGMYTFLAGLSAWLRVPKRFWLLPPFLLVVHGATTEYVQNFVGRTGTVQDALLDLGGIILGVAATWRWRR